MASVLVRLDSFHGCPHAAALRAEVLHVVRVILVYGKYHWSFLCFVDHVRKHVLCILGKLWEIFHPFALGIGYPMAICCQELSLGA